MEDSALTEPQKARLNAIGFWIWRSFLISIVGVFIGAIFKISILWAVSATFLALAVGAAGCGCFFGNRNGLSREDKRIFNLVGCVFLLIGISIVMWVWT